MPARNKPLPARRIVGTKIICYACDRPISPGRGGRRCDGHDWHSRCWNKAFEAWALGDVIRAAVEREQISKE